MSKLNQILALLLALQGGIIAFAQFSVTDNQITRPEKLFVELNPKDATKIHIQALLNQDTLKDNDYTLEKQGEQWVLRDAESYPADSKSIDAFLAKLQKAKSVQRVTSQSSYYSKLKVADSDFERKVTLSIGGKDLGFFIGSGSGPKRCHFRHQGSKDVLLVEGLLPWDVYDAASGWLDPNFFSVDQSNIWGIEVQSKGKPAIQLERGADEQWALSGLPTAVNKIALDAMLIKASKIVLDHAVGKTVKAEFGFNTPSHQVVITTGTSTLSGQRPKSFQTHRFVFGHEKKVRDTKFTYLRKQGSDWIVTVPPWALTKLTDVSIEDLSKQ
jgi:hypothetical protein